MSVNASEYVYMYQHVNTRAGKDGYYPPTDLQSETHKCFFHTQPDVTNSPPLCAFNWHRNTNSGNLSPLSLTPLLRSVAVTQMVTAVDLWLDSSQLCVCNQSDQTCDPSNKCCRICCFWQWLNVDIKHCTLFNISNYFVELSILSYVVFIT